MHRAPAKYKYTIWQCTAGDEVSGMISTKKLISGVPKENNVDLNFGYVDYTTKVVPRWNSQEGYTLQNSLYIQIPRFTRMAGPLLKAENITTQMIKKGQRLAGN